MHVQCVCKPVCLSASDPGVRAGARGRKTTQQADPKQQALGPRTTQVCVTHLCGFLLPAGRHGSYPHFCLSSFLSSVGQKRDGPVINLGELPYSPPNACSLHISLEFMQWLFIVPWLYFREKSEGQSQMCYCICCCILS